MQSSKILGLTAVCMALAACQLPAITLQVPADQGVKARETPRGQANKAKLAPVQGIVRVPTGYQGAGGDPFSQAGLIGLDAATLISAGGMNYRLSQLEERPLANALVMLADAAGNPLPGFEPTVTDGAGNFRFVRVPEGFTYVVMVAVRKDDRVAYIKGLAQAGAAPVAVDAATTLVTVNLLKETKDGGLLGQVNMDVFQEAVKKVAEKLVDTELPDLTDTAGLESASDEVVRAAGVEETLAPLRAEVKQRKAQYENELRDQRARGVVVDADTDGATNEPQIVPRSCEEAFKLRDLDGAGDIEWEEMREFLLLNLERAKQNKQTAAAREPFMEIGSIPGEEEAKANFARLDRDGDGRITLEEVCEKLPIAPPPVAITGPCLDEYKRLDRDGDGAVSFEEYSGGLERRNDIELESWNFGVKERFSKLDQNQDGKLTPEEFCGTLDACSARFARLAGDDWLIGPSEATLKGWSPEDFKKYDRNGDGFVDRGEFGAVICGEGPPPGESIPVPASCDERYKNLAGSDGFIDAEEAKRLQWDLEMFKKYDRNGDRRIDRREFGWVMCQETEVENPIGVLPVPISCDERFRKAAGASGLIDEVAARSLGWSLEMFKKYDRNGDRRIDRQEFGWAECQEPEVENPIGVVPAPISCDERFRRAAGANGLIDVVAARSLGWSLEMFKKYNRNGDDHIDRQEFGWAECQEPEPVIGLDPQERCNSAFYAAAGSDSFIDPEEAKPSLDWSLEMFKNYDRNGDDRIDRREYGWVMCQEPMLDEPITAKPIFTPIETPCSKRYNELAGRDALLSLEEARVAQLDPEKVKLSDFDGDGFIDLVEFTEMFCAGDNLR